MLHHWVDFIIIFGNGYVLANLWRNYLDGYKYEEFILSKYEIISFVIEEH